jgi:hypothetical protein
MDHDQGRGKPLMITTSESWLTESSTAGQLRTGARKPKSPSLQSDWRFTISFWPYRTKIKSLQKSGWASDVPCWYCGAR